MGLTVKLFLALVFTACVFTGVQSQHTCQTYVPPNRDCSCGGYVAKAKECDWKLKTCDWSSDAFKNFQNWCYEVNDFRDRKRNGETGAKYNRTLTCYANLSEEERQKIQLGVVIPSVSARSLSVSTKVPSRISLNTPLPKNGVDWSHLFGPAKNQGGCGSCWAFAVIGLVESWYKRRASNSNFTEQRVVNCGTNGMYGCGGGWPQNALDYLMANGNVLTSKYPYTSGSTKVAGNCTVVPTKDIVKWTPNSYFELYASKNFNGWVTNGILTPGNCTRLKQLLSQGPVQVNVQVITSFYQYKTGIYSDSACPTDGTMNHAIVAVAYIKNFNKTGIDVYKVRNSWGPGWGDKGYIYMNAGNSTHSPNTCGICSWLTYL